MCNYSDTASKASLQPSAGVRVSTTIAPEATFLRFAVTISCSVAAILTEWLHELLAATFTAGDYGIIRSVYQSTSILPVGPGKSGLANSAYFCLDLGMALGPILGGMLYGVVAIDLLYPVLSITVPVDIAVFLLNRKALDHNGSSARFVSYSECSQKKAYFQFNCTHQKTSASITRAFHPPDSSSEYSPDLCSTHSN